MSYLKKKASIKGELKLIKKMRMNKRSKIKDHLSASSILYGLIEDTKE
jgi:hypothetical protein